MTDTQVTWLTQEAFDRLKAELDQLIANRPVIAAEINDRREEGDLRENGGYHAAREEQGQQEASASGGCRCSRRKHWGPARGRAIEYGFKHPGLKGQRLLYCADLGLVRRAAPG